MSIQAFVLSLTAVIRPTALAAVLGILYTGRPRRLLAFYIGVGLVFSVGVGTIVVLVLGGAASSGSHQAAAHPTVDIVLGACSLAYAIATATGVLHRTDPPAADPPTADPPPAGPTWAHRRFHDMSSRAAGLAGVATHLPGLVYLAALNAIAASASGPAGQFLQVVMYNAIWFALAIVALVLTVYRPSASRELLEWIVAAGRRHGRTILIGFFGCLGVYLVATGVLDLLALRP